MDRADSDDLLSSLVEYMLRDDFKWVHRWRKNDLVLWDNRRTIHGVFG